MKTHYRHRRLNPAGRSSKSLSYKIPVDKVLPEDKLVVKITPVEYPDFEKRYLFKGTNVKGRNTIHFKYIDNQVVWQRGISPDEILK